MATIEQLADQLWHALETAKRDNGAEFLRLKDNSPAWMVDAIHAAHGDMLPDDWRYRLIRDAAAIISEFGDNIDAAEETLDGDVSVYTSDLLDWLTGTDRVGRVDEAVAEFGWPEGGLCQALQMGQLAERREVYELLLTALRELASDAP